MVLRVSIPFPETLLRYRGKAKYGIGRKEPLTTRRLSSILVVCLQSLVSVLASSVFSFTITVQRAHILVTGDVYARPSRYRSIRSSTIWSLQISLIIHDGCSSESSVRDERHFQILSYYNLSSFQL